MACNCFILAAFILAGSGAVQAQTDDNDYVCLIQKKAELRGATDAESHNKTLDIHDGFAALATTAHRFLKRDKGGYELFVAALSTFLILCFVGFLYQWLKPTYELPKDGEEHTAENLDGAWNYGLFDIFGNPSLCLISCCCPVVRWADTVNMSGLLGFWLALVLITGFIVISELSSGIGSIAVLALLVWCRQRHRQLFSMTGSAAPGTCRSYSEDCLTYAFCSCCAIMQEARQLEEAQCVGHPVLLKKSSIEP